MNAVVTQEERRAVDSRVVLGIVAVAVLLSSLDLFIVNVALPRIAEDFSGARISGLSWVLNAYAIVYAALLVPAGRLGDRNGHKTTFLTGLGVFVLGSALCAVAPNAGALVAFRVVQAAGAALLTPSSLGLLLAATPAERRATAVRLWVAFGGLGAALGPVLGGLLVELHWRWVFLVNVPLGIIALVVGLRLLPRPAGTGGPLPDGVGALSLIASVGSLILAVVKGQDWGWGSAGVLGAIAATLVFAAVFVISSRRHHSPVVDPGLLRVPNFTVVLANSLLFNFAFAGMLLSAVLWMQNDWGWSALKTGLGIAPGPMVVPVVAIAAGPFIARVGVGRVLALGGLAFAAGTVWWAQAVALHANYASGLLAGMLLTGLGVGLTLPTGTAAGTSGLPPQQFATGSAVLTMARQLGMAVGVAVLVAVLGSPLGGPATLDSFRHGWYVIAAASVAAGVLGLVVRMPKPATATG
ncbi:MFS transporter [Nocardia tengchongensis]|uniref:MFS transporter n=1 Tax=Nocardia tengchongensis TaxID=2055889 RepID=UPI0036AD99DB